jgi:hypothetical protein
MRKNLKNPDLTIFLFQYTIRRYSSATSKRWNQIGGYMKKNIKMLIIGAALLSVMLIAACGEGEPQEPTPDVNAVRTQAVQTAMAEMTVQAALSPSETPVPPTLTPLPTATQATAETPAASAGSSSSGSSSGSSSVPPTPPWSSLVYKCEVIDEYPLDAPQPTGADYDKHWIVKNIGKVEWTVGDFYLTWTGGDNLSGAVRGKLNQDLPHDVGVGDTVDIFVDISLPKKPVEFPGLVTNFGIVNDNGEVFCKFYHHITVIYPYMTPLPTATKVPGPD